MVTKATNEFNIEFRVGDEVVWRNSDMGVDNTMTIIRIDLEESKAYGEDEEGAYGLYAWFPQIVEITKAAKRFEWVASERGQKFHLIDHDNAGFGRTTLCGMGWDRLDMKTAGWKPHRHEQCQRCDGKLTAIRAEERAEAEQRGEYGFFNRLGYRADTKTVGLDFCFCPECRENTPFKGLEDDRRQCMNCLHTFTPQESVDVLITGLVAVLEKEQAEREMSRLGKLRHGMVPRRTAEEDVNELKGVMLGVAEDIETSGRFRFDTSNAPTIIVEDLETGRKSSLGLFAYGELRKVLAELFPEEDEPCPDCVDGYYMGTCRTCEGEGTRYLGHQVVPEGGNEACRTCDGYGEVKKRCQMCDGTGRVEV